MNRANSCLRLSREIRNNLLDSFMETTVVDKSSLISSVFCYTLRDYLPTVYE